MWRFILSNVYGIIRKSVSNFVSKAFVFNISVHEKVDLFNQTTKCMISNYIPPEALLMSAKDPPWINKRCQTKSKEEAFKTYKTTKMITKIS